MNEVTVVEVEPQIVLSMHKRGKYEEIGTMIPKVCQFAVQKGLQIQGPPIFACHEGSAEEAYRANKEGNADIEVALPHA